MVGGSDGVCPSPHDTHTRTSLSLSPWPDPHLTLTYRRSISILNSSYGLIGVQLIILFVLCAYIMLDGERAVWEAGYGGGV